ncbi:Na+/H+ antiporter subunit G [bacterium LRH843]|nr:Na+/H+ antiporter subunit G [bacterium LRH843]
MFESVIIKGIIACLVFVGAIFSLLSAIGINRLPDIYTRIHAATKTSTLTIFCILPGAFLFFWLIEGQINIRIILGIFFIFLTSPVAGHFICRSAYYSKVELAKESVQDELKAVLEKGKQT